MVSYQRLNRVAVHVGAYQEPLIFEMEFLESVFFILI